MEMDVIAIQVRPQVSCEGVEVDDRHCRRGHDFVSYSIVGNTVRGKALEHVIDCVMDHLIAGGGSHPEE